CEEMGALLAAEFGRAVSVGFLPGGATPLKGIVEQNRRADRRLVVANYLLAPGFFDDLARTQIADPDAGPGLDERALLAAPLLTPGGDRDPVRGPGEASSHGVPAGLVDIVRDRLLGALAD